MNHSCPVCSNPLHYIEENAAYDDDLWCWECMPCGIDFDIRDGEIKDWSIGHYPGIEMSTFTGVVQIITVPVWTVLFECEWKLPDQELIDLYHKYQLLQ
jgi:hypothetical protein